MKENKEDKKVDYGLDFLLVFATFLGAVLAIPTGILLWIWIKKDWQFIKWIPIEQESIPVGVFVFLRPKHQVRTGKNVDLGLIAKLENNENKLFVIPSKIQDWDMQKAIANEMVKMGKKPELFPSFSAEVGQYSHWAYIDLKNLPMYY